MKHSINYVLQVHTTKLAPTRQQVLEKPVCKAQKKRTLKNKRNNNNKHENNNNNKWGVQTAGGSRDDGRNNKKSRKWKSIPSSSYSRKWKSSLKSTWWSSSGSSSGSKSTWSSSGSGSSSSSASEDSTSYEEKILVNNWHSNGEVTIVSGCSSFNPQTIAQGVTSPKDKTGIGSMVIGATFGKMENRVGRREVNH